MTVESILAANLNTGIDNLTDNFILENAGQGAGQPESVPVPLIGFPNPWLGRLLLVSLLFMLNLPCSLL